MTRLRRQLGGFRALFRKNRVEQELDVELRAFLEMSIEERMRKSIAAREDAIRAARIEIGGIDAVKDNARDVGVGSPA